MLVDDISSDVTPIDRQKRRKTDEHSDNPGRRSSTDREDPYIFRRAAGTGWWWYVAGKTVSATSPQPMEEDNRTDKQEDLDSTPEGGAHFEGYNPNGQYIGNFRAGVWNAQALAAAGAARHFPKWRYVSKLCHKRDWISITEAHGTQSQLEVMDTPNGTIGFWSAGTRTRGGWE